MTELKMNLKPLTDKNVHLDAGSIFYILFSIKFNLIGSLQVLYRASTDQCSMLVTIHA